MFLKLVLKIFLLLIFFVLQSSVFSFLPFFSYLNLPLLFLIILCLIDQTKKISIFALALIMGILSDLTSPRFFGFYLLNSFIWIIFFDWLIERFTILNPLSIFLLSLLGFLSYEMCILLLEKMFFLFKTIDLITSFNKLFFLRLIKVIFVNAFLSTIICWRFLKRGSI